MNGTTKLLGLVLLLANSTMRELIAESPAIDEPGFRAKLGVSTYTLDDGSHYVQCILTCERGAVRVLNPFLDLSFALFAEVTIEDRFDKAVIKIPATKVLQGRAEYVPSLLLRSHQSTGRRFRIKAAKTPSLNAKTGELQLVPGDYRVRVKVFPPAVQLHNNTGDEFRDPLAIAVVCFSVSEAGRVSHSEVVSPIELTIKAEATTLLPTSDLALTVRGVNRCKESLWCYNVLFDPLLPDHAASLLLTKPNGDKAIDLLDRDSGSFRRPTSDDWIIIPVGGIAEAVHRVPVRKLMNRDEGPLAIGEYGAIAIIHAGYDGTCPFDLVKDPAFPGTNHDLTYREWRTGLPGDEVSRSNAIKIKISSGNP